MTEKRIVDDYYSNISQDASQRKEDGEEKKRIKLKKKVVASDEIISKEESSQEEKKTFKIKKPLKKKEEENVVVEEKEETFKKEEKKKNEWVKQKIIVESSTEEEKEKEEPKTSYKFTLAENKPADFSHKDHGKKFNKKKKQGTGELEEEWRKRKKDFTRGGRRRNKFQDVFESEERGFIRSNKINKKKEEKKVEDIIQNLTSRSWQTVFIDEVLSLKELSEKIGVPLPKLIAEFMKNGMMVNINSKIDFDSASIVAEAFEVKLEKSESTGISVEDLMTGNIVELLQEDDVAKLQERPPVISIMGHVDHGKTSLLDYIRNTKVVQGEAGGITQSIGAYQVEQNGKKITFLDTPWHEAFTVMRARGAKATDIAILVVAADEWVKPQTIESINHAKEAGIPVIVAINKMDKEGANPDNVKSQLSENGLIPEDWGGDTPMIPVSAKTWFGIDSLLEVILLIAEMKELKANPERQWVGTIIESHLDNKLWPVATLLVNTGTIKMGDNVVCRDTYGKVKVLKDYSHKNVKQVFPWDPVLVIGLEKVVEGGDILQVVGSIEKARQKAIEYKEIIENIKSKSKSSLDVIMAKIKSGNLKQLKIVLKADTNGSLEAIKGSLLKLSTEETSVMIIHSGVGNITESDIMMCQWSDAILVWFRVWIATSIKNLTEDLGVELIESDVIYHITEKIEKIILGMLDPKEEEVILWQAVVWGVFYASKEFMILWLKFSKEWRVEKKSRVRVIKGDKIIWHGDVQSVKQWVEEVNSFEWPWECGIKYKGNYKPELGDILEFYKIEIKK